MKLEKIWYKILQWIYHYLVFFLLMAFLVSCSTMLFATKLSASLGIEYTDENLSVAAKYTFVNVVILSVVFTVIDIIRRKLTVDRVTKHIAEAAKKVVEGDFSVRIKPVVKLGMDRNINDIIDCFNMMTQELEGVETLRTDFIANVSHEMKTPLAVIRNYGVLLQNPELEEEKRIEYAKGVTDGSGRMASMMTNVLKLNRLEKQQIYPKKEEFNLGEQLCECMIAFEPEWERKSIEPEVNIEEDVIVVSDRELLDLVWNNLLSNAFKFTPEGGRVAVTLKTDDDNAMVLVTDTGCGISAADGERIFEKFYQGDTSHSIHGNGLGLALVKRVVDILQAEISVESIPDEGSTFTVKFRRNRYEER